MNRETTEEKLLALRDSVYELAKVCHEVALRVDVLWEERAQWRASRAHPPEDLKPMDCFGDERE